MECRFCRGEIPEGANVCPYCGTPVEPEQTKTEDVEQSQGGYQYGMPEQSQGGYQYGSPEQSQGGYQYGSPEQSQGGYQYGSSEQSQGGYQYGSSGQNNYGQPERQLSGTPYMVFAIISTLLCCLPLGIVAIVYASKISSLQKAGDYAGAQEAAKKARLFTILGAVIGLIVSIIYIAIAVAGMKEAMPKTSVALEENMDAENEPAVDEAEGDDVDANDMEEAGAPVEPSQVNGELGSTWQTYTAQINGQLLTFPCTMEELKATGLTQDTDETPEDYVVNVNEYTWVFFENAEEEYIMVDVVNTSDEPKSVGECLVGGITADEWGSGGAIDIVFPGGIQFGVGKDAVLAAYGEADDVYEGDSIHIYTWEDENSIYSSCEIEFDAETGLVSRMNMQNFGE